MLFEKVHKTIKIEIDETKNKLNKLAEEQDKIRIDQLEKKQLENEQAESKS